MTQDEINDVMGWPLNTIDADPDSLVYRVNALVQSAVAAEREACAKVALGYLGCDVIAEAIRARGNT